ncbi:MAG: VOC family protein [Candidatus Marinimicrobia bacterium]|nr:VOC family protein [Candidatus Neomarinimicrobiota bacterium]
MIKQNLIIFYVTDQKAAMLFYKSILDSDPSLDVPGMTEFKIGSDSRLGLMPLAGAKKLLSEEWFPMGSKAFPMAELYLSVDNAEGYLDRAIKGGATLIQKVENRDWGDRAGYCLDPDGHVLAFAEAL